MVFTPIAGAAADVAADAHFLTRCSPVCRARAAWQHVQHGMGLHSQLGRQVELEHGTCMTSSASLGKVDPDARGSAAMFGCRTRPRRSGALRRLAASFCEGGSRKDVDSAQQLAF